MKLSRFSKTLFTLLVAFSFRSVLTNAQSPDTLVAWKETGLNLQKIREMLSLDNCVNSKKHLLGCIRALHETQKFLLSDGLQKNSVTEDVRTFMQQFDERRLENFPLEKTLLKLQENIGGKLEEAFVAGHIYSAYLSEEFDAHAHLVLSKEILDNVRAGSPIAVARFSSKMLHLKIKNFSDPRLVQKIKAGFTLTKIREDDILVIDIRGNLGGREKMAVDVANLFLDKSTVVLREETLLSNLSPRSLAAPLDKIKEIPMAGSYCVEERAYSNRALLLVDAQTAGAAEIFAAALQFHDSALVVGDRSFGRGLIQEDSESPFGEKILIRKSTKKIYFPNAMNSFHGIGILPDISLEDLGLQEPLALREENLDYGAKITAGLALKISPTRSSLARGLLACLMQDAQNVRTQDSLLDLIRKKVSCFDY